MFSPTFQCIVLGSVLIALPLYQFRGRLIAIINFIHDNNLQTMHRKYPSSKVTHVETRYCPEGLSSAKSRALITCSTGQSQLLKREPESSVPVDLKLSLVGLNIVYCSTEGPGRVLSASGYSCSDGFYNDNSTTACTYVLCDGKLVFIAFRIRGHGVLHNHQVF